MRLVFDAGVVLETSRAEEEIQDTETGIDFGNSLPKRIMQRKKKGIPPDTVTLNKTPFSIPTEADDDTLGRTNFLYV